MKIPERNEYLNKHRRRGDLVRISRDLDLSISTVRDIVDGKFVGTNGENVLKKLEELVDKRVQQAKVLSRKYKKKIDESL